MYSLVRPRYHSCYDPLAIIDNFDPFYDWFHLPQYKEIYCRRPKQSEQWTHKIDLSGYENKDISVKNEDGKVLVKGRHQEGEDYTEMSRSVVIPDDVDKEKVSCSFTADHQLLIRGPRKDLVPAKTRKTADLLDQLICNSRVVKSEDGGEVFQIDIPCKDFKPEELKMHQEGNRVTVEAEHKSDTEYKSYRREFSLPAGAESSKLTCSMDNKGTLRVEAPYQEVEDTKTKEISIEKSKTEHRMVEDKESKAEDMEQ